MSFFNLSVPRVSSTRHYQMSLNTSPSPFLLFTRLFSYEFLYISSHTFFPHTSSYISLPHVLSTRLYHKSLPSFSSTHLIQTFFFHLSSTVFFTRPLHTFLLHDLLGISTTHLFNSFLSHISFHIFFPHQMSLPHVPSGHFFYAYLPHILSTSLVSFLCFTNSEL